jgi:hypothetical protein
LAQTLRGLSGCEASQRQELKVEQDQKLVSRIKDRPAADATCIAMAKLIAGHRGASAEM